MSTPNLLDRFGPSGNRTGCWCVSIDVRQTGRALGTDEGVGVHLADDDTAMALSGRLDGRCTPQVREALYARIDADEGDVVVDLSHVESMDGTVLTLLAAAAVRLQRTGRALVLRGCSDSVRRLVAFGGLRRLFVWERDA